MANPLNAYERATEVANELVGTCHNLQNYATPDELDAAAFCATLDDLIFCCDCCDWWFEVGKQGEDGLCSDCTKEANADDW